MFYKKAALSKFRNIHAKTPVLESLLVKLKKDFNTGVFLLRSFLQNTYVRLFLEVESENISQW